MSFPGGWDGKESVCNVGDLGSIPGSGRSPGEGMTTHSSILAWRIPWQSRECVYQPLSCVWLFETPWTVAHQASPSMGFSRQEYWSGLPFPFSGDLPNPGIESGSPALQADSLPSNPPGKPPLNKQKYKESWHLPLEGNGRKASSPALLAKSELLQPF